MKPCVRYFDAHCHLPSEGEWPVCEMPPAEVKRMAVCGTRLSDWGPILHQSKTHPQMVPMIGLHPWFVSNDWSADFQRLENILMETPTLGIGETGLDFQARFMNRTEQEGSFAAHLELAGRLNRPVAVHCVRAWGRLIEILREVPTQRVLLHSFGGTKELLPELISLHCWFSFGAAVANPAYKRMREVLASVPAERLLIETDSTEIDALNDSAELLHVAHGVAQLRGVPVHSILESTWNNAVQFFNVI